MSDDAVDLTLDDLATPRAFAQRYPEVVGSESRLRYLLRHREQNGLNRAVLERGRKLWIVKPRFLDWIAGGGR